MPAAIGIDRLLDKVLANAKVKKLPFDAVDGSRVVDGVAKKDMGKGDDTTLLGTGVTTGTSCP